MKLSSYVVKQVFDFLIQKSITTKLHKNVKPTGAVDAEYIVINTMGLDVEYVQQGYVNINCHVKNAGPGIPNRTRLDVIANSVISAFEADKYTIGNSPKLLFKLERMEDLPEKPPIEEWYTNLFFKVIIHKN